MPNVMATQPNIGGALCESPVIQFPVARRKVWLMPAAGVPCSNAANIGERKTWTRSEFCTWQNSVRPRKSIKSNQIYLPTQNMKEKNRQKTRSKAKCEKQ